MPMWGYILEKAMLEGTLSPLCILVSCQAFTRGTVCTDAFVIARGQFRVSLSASIVWENRAWAIKPDQYGHWASNTTTVSPSSSTAFLPRTGTEYEFYSASFSPSADSGAGLNPVRVRVAWLPWWTIRLGRWCVIGTSNSGRRLGEILLRW